MSKQYALVSVPGHYLHTHVGPYNQHGVIRHQPGKTEESGLQVLLVSAEIDKGDAMSALLHYLWGGD